LVRRCAGVDGLFDFRHDTLSLATPNAVNLKNTF
jgi:hypothetical protein